MTLQEGGFTEPTLQMKKLKVEEINYFPKATQQITELGFETKQFLGCRKRRDLAVNLLALMSFIHSWRVCAYFRVLEKCSHRRLFRGWEELRTRGRELWFKNCFFAD